MLILVWLMLLTAPAFAQESILLNVNQTHTLQWDWAQGEAGPLRTFVFQCQQYRKELEADTRSLYFRSLIDQPGRYTGCTLAAKNDAGISAPVLVPDFEYAYSYGTLGWLLLECLASVGAVAGIVSLYGRKLLVAYARQCQRPLALAEPLSILEKERDHVHHDT